MSIIATIALLAGPVAAALPAPQTASAVDTTHAHDVRIDHRHGPIDARYQGRLVVSQRQVGAVAPNGRPSSLRCVWQADVVVDRAAHHPSGSTMLRAIRRDAVMTGSRPGWCTGARTAIDREVAARTDRVRAQLAAIAADDRPTLVSEVESLHAAGTAG